MVAHSRDYYIRQNARKFFIARFRRDPNHRVEKEYFNEWVSRFKTGVPENYMDSKSRDVYTQMKFGKFKLPPTKVWKGKGGITVRIVKVK